MSFINAFLLCFSVFYHPSSTNYGIVYLYGFPIPLILLQVKITRYEIHSFLNKLYILLWLIPYSQFGQGSQRKFSEFFRPMMILLYKSDILNIIIIIIYS